MTDIQEKTLAEWVIEATVEKDGRKTLSCAEAFRLAEEKGIELLAIARVCNRRDVKIVRCQLGCFK